MKKKLLLLITIFSTYSLLLPLTVEERRAQFHQEMADRDQAALDRQTPQEDEAENDEDAQDVEDNDCFICRANENEVVLDCDHQFCQTCIDRVLNRELAWNAGDDNPFIQIRTTQCPLCRANITRDSVYPIGQREAIRQQRQQREAIRQRRREVYRRLRQIGRPFIPIIQGGLRAFQCYYTYRYVKDTAKLWKQTSYKKFKFPLAIPLDLSLGLSTIVFGVAASQPQTLPARLGPDKANQIAFNAGVGLMSLCMFDFCALESVGKLFRLDKLSELLMPKEMQAHKELLVSMLKAYIKNHNRFILPHALGVAARYNLGSFADVQWRNGQIFFKPSWRALLTKNGLLFAAGAAAGGYYAPKIYKVTSKVADAYSGALTKYLW